MMTLRVNNNDINIDNDGFLSADERWTEDVAKSIANHEGIHHLDENKMKIVHFMREYYLKHHNFPILGNVCKNIGANSRDCVAKEFVNPMKAWKIAGLPKPPSIFFTSFDKKTYSANPFY